MNLKREVISLVTMLIVTIHFSYAQKWVQMMQDPNANFYEVQKEFNNYWKGKEITKGNGYKQFKRWEYLMQSRVDMNGKLPPVNYFQNELKKYQAIHASDKIAAAANWTPIGPTSALGLEQGIGRVQCFAMDPNNSNNYWAGTPGGGLWKSTNAGASWTTNTDDFVSLGISSILINPSNSNIMYISTGDPDGRHTVSTGVLKSTDGGNTWTQTGLNFTTTQGKDIDQLKFLPNNPNVILAATSDGIYRSSNAGTSWTLISNTTSTYDIAFHPTNANIVYAVCSSNFVKSTDGGVTWSVITSGLPTSLGDARVAITPAAPNNVYILIAQGDFFKSTNSGTSFTKVSTNSGLGNQTWWDLVLEVNPTDPNLIYVAGVWFSNSTDGGITWNSSFNNIHADDHNMYFYGNAWFICNDGGLYRSIDNGVNWELLHNGMQIMQFYRMSSYAHNPSHIIGGTQDNGTSMLRNNTWKQVSGGDGMDNALSKSDPDVAYASYQNGILLRLINGGSTSINGNINEAGPWVTPFLISPTNHDSIIAGFQNLWISNVGGNTWTKISSFNMSVGKILINWNNPSTIYASAGGLQKTTNGGSTWTTVTTPEYGDRGYTIDTKNSNRIWLGSTGYTAGNKIYYSSNAGQSWTNISGTFPNMPILCMEYLPGSNDGIYVGTEVGLFYKDASMSDWIYYDQGLPNVRIDDIDFDMVNGKIRVATYGRGIWESPLHPDANAKPVAEFDYSTKSGCKGLTLTFNAGGSFNATSWNWNFQGGTPSTSTSKNPTVTYNTSGTFSVSLTASNVNGSSTFSKPGVVVISTDEVNNNYPYTQNFDNLITGDEVNLGGWINGTDDERNWRVHSGSAPGAVGPSGDHTSGNGKYLLFQPTGTGYWGNLYSPCLNLSSLSNPVFEYYVYVDDLKNMDPLYLDVQVDGKLQTDVFPAVEKIGNFWLKKTVDLTPYANKTIQLRFRAKSAHTDRAYAIDDIKIYSRPNAAPVADFIANPTYDVVGFTAKFYDQSSNLPTAYSWSFPGGTPSTSTAANPEITYSTSGQYNVSLTATNAYGSHTATKSSYITVNGTEYNMSNRTVTDCVGRLFDSGGQNGDYGNNENFTFTIAPSGTELVKLTFESWGLSDGDALSIYDGTSTSAPLIGSYGGFFIPNEIVATSGKVTLKFSSNETGTRSGFAISWQAKGGNTCSPGTTIPAPIADFSSTITSTTAPYSVELIDNSQNNPVGWTWLLPGADLERVYNKNTTAIYNTPGTYTITLIVVNEGGRNTISKTITITAPPVEINMKNGTETSCNGTLYDDGGPSANYLNSKAYTLVIQPAGATSVTINFSQWAVENNYDFLRIYNGTSTSAPQLGNGWSGTSPGTVTANSGAMTLRFTSDANTTAAGWKATWSATGGTCGGTTPAPVANFTASATTITAGSSVNFTDLSTNTPTSWSWSFQGGTPATSTVKNPTVSYSVAGTYSVALRATNAGGSDSEIKTAYITVQNPAPVTDFSANTTTVTVGSTVQFTDLSTNSPTSWNWIFQGGNPATSTVKNPSVIYSTAGTYSVSLTATNASGSNTKNKTAYIVVNTSSAPVANFTASATTITAGSSVNFTDLSTNTPTSWSWSFQGGTPATSTVKNPTVSYSVAGTYSVALTATNAGGSNTKSVNGYITVTTGGGVTINMKNGTETSCNGTLYDDGGATGNYLNSKVYTLVIQPAGATSVTINFSQWAVENNYDFLRIYNGTSTSAPQLGNGWSGTSPGTVTANSGAMTLRFTSDANTTAAGWKATWSATGGTCGGTTPAPVANFTASATTITAGSSVNFTDLSTNTPTSWSWSFQGGTPATSTVKNPTVSYSVAGTYSVALTATNAGGSNTKSVNGYITVTTGGGVTINMKNGTETSCNGTLYDDGGPSANYLNSKAYTLVIQPAGATSVTINFSQWAVENNYDFLRIYNGTSTSAPQLGNGWSGTSPGTVTANSGAMTLRFTSDGYVNAAGWKATWSCTNSFTEGDAVRILYEENDFIVYPNPTAGEFTVTMNKKYEQLTISDITGSTLLSIPVQGNQMKVQLPDFKAGLYFIQLHSGSEIKTQKLIVQ